MGNSFYFLPVILSIVNSPRIMDIGEPHEVVTTTVVPSPVLCIVSFSSLICYHACAYWIRMLLVEVCPRNESHPRSLDRWLSSQHRSRLQRLMEHRHKVWTWCPIEYTISLWFFSSSSLKHFEAYSNLILLLLLLLRCRFISPVVIAPVTTIVGLGLLEYGFPGVCIYLRLFLFHYRPFLEVCSVAVGLGPWNFLLRWHFWNVCKVEFLGFICAGWQVCWNRHSSTVDYIIYLSGVSFV